MTFKDLPIGARFCFPTTFPADYPQEWQKVDSRHYRAVWGDEFDSHTHLIGSMSAKVLEPSEALQAHRKMRLAIY